MRIDRHIFSLLACLPLLLSCSAGQAVAQPPFEYRAIYSPTNAREEVRTRYATNHVDYDWDLWGHNLRKVVGPDANPSVYATVADTLCHAQYCFSSKELYRIIEDYILDQYGEGTDTYSARICIMPADNKLACTCAACRRQGGGVGNATPAVTAMLLRLARRFPRHQFFTSSYHSTKTPPKVVLPDNVGVLISAIDLPLRVDFKGTEGYRRFLSTVEAWKKVCRKLYVWDYERNYEDYLSPFPCLMAMQSRIRLYRTLGIRGVFINGSGDEYSSFDDVQTVVLAQMLEDPDIDVDAKVMEYLREAYPKTATLIGEYYLGLEHRTASTNHLLPLYGTMQEMQESYLSKNEFVSWRRKLDKASKSTSKPERTRLNYLLTALSYTWLQMMHADAGVDEEEFYEMREILRGHSELRGMDYISESYRKIDDYIKKIRPRK